jgi:hypothetical protein
MRNSRNVDVGRLQNLAEHSVCPILQGRNCAKGGTYSAQFAVTTLRRSLIST